MAAAECIASPPPPVPPSSSFSSSSHTSPRRHQHLHLAIVGPCYNATGNKTTVERLSLLFKAMGHTTTLWDSSSDSVLPTCLSPPDVCFLLHAYRSAAFLTTHFSGDSGAVPIVLIFGGTDINEMVADATRLQKMRTVVDRAAVCVCFSAALLKRACEHWPQHRGKLRIIPQSVPIVAPTPLTPCTLR
eukprot:NODE_2062_length_655_cov_98.483498_g1617_i0.p1 GENE.NODE_2062_length_655_cov_98.483498_g1617_i0~~NODE_2062_length_655_cov_98.483498_g1617_i0.p1  ORF type:complete len:217 (-),score=59.10 NODE_2062_length_655_cov_98.483498_g1617_i0:3-566(-)